MPIIFWPAMVWYMIWFGGMPRNKMAKRPDDNPNKSGE